MKLGGWVRLLIVVSVIYAFFVLVIAYSDRPTREKIKHSWIYEAGNVLATKISAETDQEIRGFRIVDVWEKTENSDQIITRIEAIEKSPSENQKTISPELTKVNAKYREQLENFNSELAAYIFKSFLWWFLPVLAFYFFGYSIGWIIKGFRQKAA